MLMMIRKYFDFKLVSMVTVAVSRKGEIYDNIGYPIYGINRLILLFIGLYLLKMNSHLNPQKQLKII